MVAATPVKMTTAPLPPQSPEVGEQVEDMPEDEAMDDLDLGLGLEEALQGTFTSQPEKHGESVFVCVCVCLSVYLCVEERYLIMPTLQCKLKQFQKKLRLET